MGHKGPVKSRPRCIGAERPRTQIQIYQSIWFPFLDPEVIKNLSLGATAPMIRYGVQRSRLLRSKFNEAERPRTKLLIFHQSINLSIYLFIYLFSYLSGTVHIYTETIDRTTKHNLGRALTVPCLCELYTGICLTAEEKHGKTSVRVAEECQLAR
jgi:hypothetical protein